MPIRPSSPRPAASSGLPAWGALCFFVSGAAGLLYEVVWSKQFTYLLGNSLHAVATVVAAFLGGLALGARLLGSPLARRGDGARTYARIELGIAVLGVLSLPVLRGLDPLVGEMYRSLGGEGVPFALARFALLFALLIPPAALMGATLPVLVGHFERDRVGPTLARLYALNTLGAVAGSAAGGFLLLPRLGLAATTWVAAALNLIAALVAWRAGGPAAAGTAGARAAEAAVVPAPEPAGLAARGARGALPGEIAGGARRALAVLFALSGAAALAFQIAWVRLFTLVFGTSVYSFSAVLGLYLLGLALGSAASAPFLRRGVTLPGFARLQLALAAASALMLPAFSRLPEWMFELGSRAGTRWGALFAGELALVAGLLIVPCALMGAAFPIATRLLQRGGGGDAAGFAYAVNTAGTITGSLVAGFLMIPTLGVQGTHLAAVALTGAIGIAALALARARGESGSGDAAFAAVAVLLAAGAAMLAPRWDPALMSSGLYRPTEAAKVGAYSQVATGPGPTVWRATRRERVLYYHEGLNGSVALETDEEGKERWLRVGGKIDAGTGDMETQVLLGLIPAALADSGARTLVVGLGSGITAAAVLAGGAGATDVVEIERGVVEASRWFHGPGENPLDDPRTHLILGDARTHLAHGRGRYGLIVSEPSNPWIAGVNNLFTVDYYRRVRARLEPDGVFCQWMQLYELSPATFGSMVRSFLTVFPEGQVFAVWRSVDVLLVAMPEGRSLSLDRLRGPAARRMLERAKIRSPEGVAGYYAGPFAGLAPAANGAPLNLDDRPIVEYRAPRDLIEVGAVTGGKPLVAALVPFSETVPRGPLFSAWSPEAWYEARTRVLLEHAEPERAERSAHGAETAGLAALGARLRNEIESGRRRQLGMAEVERATTLIATGRDDEGRQALERAVAIDPDNGRTWLMLADRRRLASDLAGAEAAIAHGRASSDPEIRADAAMVSGLLEISRGRPRDAAARFAEAQRLNPALGRAYLMEARVWLGEGDAAAARAAIQRGLAAAPGDPDLAAALAQLGNTP